MIDEWRNKVIQGDCLKLMDLLPDNSIDTIITDPPYGLGFMGKKWDTFDKSQFGRKGSEGVNDLKVKKNFNILPRYNTDGLYDFTKSWSTECLRVLKPGGTMLSFAGSRTQHKIMCGIEDAGFILKDVIMWVYATGFPKALDISKAIDKKFEDKSDEAKLWSGWKSHGLKPAYEPIIVAVKPNDKTYVNNALKWGVSGLNIDGSRIGTEIMDGGTILDLSDVGQMSKESCGINKLSFGQNPRSAKRKEYTETKMGRFPATLILDDYAGERLDKQTFGKFGNGKQEYFGVGKKDKVKGGASRFFKNIPLDSRLIYVPKASKSERNKGLENNNLSIKKRWNNAGEFKEIEFKGNIHPTVKPIKLMEYLATLTKTPTGGLVLDPFMGSGTTGIACKNVGRDFIGFELSEEYCEIARARIEDNK